MNKQHINIWRVFAMDICNKSKDNYKGIFKIEDMQSIVQNSNQLNLVLMKKFISNRRIAITGIGILGGGTLLLDQLKVRIIPYSGLYRRLAKKLEQQTIMIKGSSARNQQGKPAENDYKNYVEQLLSSEKQVSGCTTQTANKIRAIQNIKSEKLTRNHLYSIGINAIGALVVPHLYLGSMLLYFATNTLHIILQVNMAKNGKQNGLRIKFKQLSSIYVVFLPFTVCGLFLNNLFRGGSLLKQLRQTKDITSIKK